MTIMYISIQIYICPEGKKCEKCGPGMGGGMTRWQCFGAENEHA